MDLSTRTARRRLPADHRQRWVRIARGRALGYRRYSEKSPGTWYGRIIRGTGSNKVVLRRAIGTADDTAPADGEEILSYAQALAKAAAWDPEAERQHVRETYTVSDAMRDYLDSLGVTRLEDSAGREELSFEGARKSARQVEQVARVHIEPELGDVVVAKLTSRRLRAWRDSLARKPARRRSGKGRAPNFAPQPESDEARRARRATANRVLAVLRAALNFAFSEGLVESADAWGKRVKPFRGVEEPRIDYLTRDEARRLVNACDPDFQSLVLGALATGCRYGELVRMRARDYEPDARAVRVSETKAGRPRHVHLSAEGVDLFEELTAGRRGEEPIFQRKSANGTRRPWRRAEQQRPLAAACERANMRTIHFHVLRHTHGSWLAQAGVDLLTISHQLGHADTRITQRHYAHLLPSHVSEAVKRSLPPLGLEPSKKVKRMRRTRRSS